MCIFRDRKLVEVHNLKKSEAITAYKAIEITYAGEFVSPMQGTPWPGRIFQHNAIAGADFDSPWEVPGIHCMRAMRTASYHGSVVVRVSMWGEVYEYGRAKPDRFQLSGGGPGYLAQKVRIDAVVWTEPHVFTEDGVVKALKRYRGLLDERTKK